MAMAMPGLSGPVGSAYGLDPRTQLVQTMLANNTSGAPQYGGPWAGVAKALSGIAAAYTGKKIRDEYGDRQKAYQDTLASAYGVPAAAPAAQMANTMASSTPFTNQANPAQTAAPQTPTVPGNMVGQQIAAAAGPVAQEAPQMPADPQQAMLAKLMSNPDTMEQASKLMEARATQQLEASKPITPFERAQLGGEQIVDSQGNMVPKYQFGRNGSIDASGNATPSPAAQAAMGSMGAPGMPATAAVATPKAVNAGQEKVAQNLADTASPKAGEDPVQSASDLLATISQAQRDNETAPGGTLAGPINQMVGRVTNDALLTQDQAKGRDAYTNLESAAKNIAAKAAKTQFPQRVTNSDLMIAQQGMAFAPGMSKSERTTRLNNMFNAGQRAYDMSAITKGAAMENAEVAPGDIRAYYLSKGVDPETFQPTKAQPLPENLARWMGKGGTQGNPQNTPQAPANAAPIKVLDAAGYAQVPKGAHYMDKDGNERVKQ